MTTTLDLPARVTSWQTTKPPKDRPIIINGKIIREHEFGTECIPVNTEARWKEEIQQWVGPDDLNLVWSDDDRLVIHNWIDLPAQ